MTRFIGVDYGTQTIKAAATDSSRGEVALLSLGAENPFFQPIFARDSVTGRFVVGPSASRDGKKAGEIVADFRDKLIDPAASVQVGGKVIDAVKLQKLLFHRLGSSIQSLEIKFNALAVSVPDDWSASRWSLPIALRTAGWQPRLFVREWAAVLASLDRPPAERIVVMSLGASSVRATMCESDEGYWRAVSTSAIPDIHLGIFTRRLRDHIAEIVIRDTRLDLREDPTTHYQLMAAIETSLRKHRGNSQLNIPIPLSTGNVQQTISRSSLDSIVASWQSQVQGLAHHLAATGSPSTVSDCPIMAYGALASLLPLAEWFNGRDIKIMPLDVVAAGAARLCARECEKELSLPEVSLLNTSDGRYSQSCTLASKNSDTVPLIEMLPADQASRKSIGSLRLLGPDGDGELIRITTRRFRLGRHPDSEWLFAPDVFPQVSVEHAVIVRKADDYMLKDLDSTNGTFVNEQRIREHCLKNGDVIRLGQDEPRFRFENKQ